MRESVHSRRLMLARDDRRWRPDAPADRAPCALPKLWMLAIAGAVPADAERGREFARELFHLGIAQGQPVIGFSARGASCVLSIT